MANARRVVQPLSESANSTAEISINHGIIMFDQHYSHVFASHLRCLLLYRAINQLPELMNAIVTKVIRCVFDYNVHLKNARVM